MRKTPKQCKARWYEWLDPSIKKIEWSKEEDEKLLHMAKLMPTQWRTIAPIVGRTATQCLERYQQLLDDAEAQDSELGLAGPGSEAGPSADDIRRLRPGEIDPDPESRPAKPDPVDMDDEEKEMLSEARARLANTEGKKAKRKARERALDEARRLSTLQKRRELKAAGIFIGRKRVGIDYNADIPFEKQPAPGFYDTTEEAAKTYENPMRRTEQQMEPGGVQSEEEQKKRRERAAQRPAKHEEAIRRLRDAEQVTKRRRLELPAAHVDERELEQVVKLGHAGRAARALVEGEEDVPSNALLGDYAPLERTPEARTPTTQSRGDALLHEARLLHQRTVTQTPLLGGENAPESRAVDEPPATPAAPPAATPRATPGATPRRDVLGLNDPGDVPATPRDARLAARAVRDELRASLQSLPAPKNDFEIVVDGAPDVIEAADAGAAPIEDAAVRDARLAREAAAAHAAALARRTQVVQRGLPRPIDVDEDAVRAQLAALRLPGASAAAAALVDDEVARLMADDARVFPLPGSRHAGGARSALAPPPDALLTAARSLVHAELAGALGFPGAKPEALRGLIAADASVDAARARAEAALAYDAERDAWVPRDELPAAARVAGYAARLERLRAQMSEAAAAAARGEKTLGKLLGGYQARSKALAGKITGAAHAYEDSARRLVAFERLAAGEQAAAAARLQRAEADVARLQAVESAAQREFRDADAARAAAQEAYEEVQTELEMRLAEAAVA